MSRWHQVTGLLLLASGLGSCTVLLDFGEVSADVLGAPDADSMVDGGNLPTTDTHDSDHIAEPPPLFLGTCTELLPGDLTEEEALSEDTLLLGTILPLTGELGPYGPGMRDGVELAIQEINQSGGVFGRELAILSCDSETKSESATEATRHLAALGVPAIIGPAGSTITIEAFQDAAHEAEVVVISPSATSPEISQLADDDLLWRTVPSDEEQGKALAGAIDEQGFERVAVVSRDDTYGNGLRERIQAELCGVLGFDCATSYKGFVYAPPEGETFDLDFVPTLRTYDPNLVIMVSYLDDGVAGIQALSAQGLMSFWVTDGMKNEELGPLIDNQDVVCKLLGTSPAEPTTFYSGFTTNFETKFGQKPGIFVANSYDALYVVAYAAAAALDLYGTVDGPSIAAGLKRLSGDGAAQFEVGRLDWNAGIQALTSTADAQIDLTGASGALEFDPDTGQPSGPVEVWRFGVGSGEIESLGVIYTPVDGYVTLPPEALTRDGICEL